MHTEQLSYDLNGQTYIGYLAYDAATTEPRPGVLVVHEWWGATQFVRDRAEELARQGYVALAIDMYGDGKTTDQPDQAAELMNAVLADLDDLNARFAKSVEVIKALPQTDPEKIAAIGYCFGGATVINAARAGMELGLVASFHGSLGTERPAQSGVVKTPLWVFHGGDDPIVDSDQVTAFKAEMDAAGADYQFVNYPGVKHSFTNPGADALAENFGLPMGYDATATQDSWNQTLAALAGTFGG